LNANWNYTPNPGDKTVWWCPSEEIEIPADKWTDANFAPNAYGLYFNWRYWPQPTGKRIGFTPIPLNALPNPAQEVALRDAFVTTTVRYYAYDNGSNNYDRHEGHANVLYYDGHVNAVPRP
jgi:prepilin-type processing-associated H-X9-DG protein